MPDKTDYLKDYVQVKDRVTALYDLFGTARIETTYELTTEPDEKPKVICRAMVYRTPDDPHPSTGTSWMYLPGTTNFTKGSELENCETSAIGRAIGFLGILIDKSIASANEIAAKDADAPARPAPEHLPPREGSLIGIAEAAKAPHDFELRQTPEGAAIGFKLTEGKAQVRVLAADELAFDIADNLEAIAGKRVQVYGSMTQEEWITKAGTKDEYRVPYTRLMATRLTGPDGLALPVPTDAPTEPMFSEDEEKGIDAALARVK